MPDILWGCWSLSKRNRLKDRQLGSPRAQNVTNGPSAPFTEGKPEASLAVPSLRPHRQEELGYFVAQAAYPPCQYSCPLLGWGVIAPSSIAL